MAKFVIENDFPDRESKEQYLNDLLKKCKRAVIHYEFAIREISEPIDHPALEANKRPVIPFLKNMKAIWQSNQKKVQEAIDALDEEDWDEFDEEEELLADED